MQHFSMPTFSRLGLLSLVFAGVCFGRPLVVLAADPNSCGPQRDRSRAVPFALPAPEPNEPWGSILGPSSSDPNLWEVPAGPFKRDGKACDPDGDSFTVTFLGGTSPAVAQLDVKAEWWSFAATVIEGVNAWRFEASDGRASRIVTVVVWGKRNEPPVLE